MIYFFILGKNSNLSIAEIQAVLGDFKLKKLNSEVLIAEFNRELDLKQIIKKLGGTVKIGKILTQLDLNIKAQDIVKYLNPQDKKMFFGFSFYNFGADAGFFNSKIKNIQKLGLETKKILKNEHEISSRLVESRESVLSSVIVAKNKLLTRGKELNFFIESNQIYLGETVVVQDFEAYGDRDFGRPNRDSRSGMLPPKLAKIMINLAQIDQDKIILDPFCGSGTVIQEAVLLGYKNIIGSDVSEKAIEYTQKNLDWLEEKKLASELETKVFQADVAQISQEIEISSIDAIATEPFLGPPRFHDNQIDGIIRELSSLYLKAFEEFKKILVPGGRVVIVFPAWKADREIKYLPILKEIENLGFRQIKFENMTPGESRSGLVYGREGQRIVREIWVWEG